MVDRYNHNYAPICFSNLIVCEHHYDCPYFLDPVVNESCYCLNNKKFNCPVCSQDHFEHVEYCAISRPYIDVRIQSPPTLAPNNTLYEVRIFKNQKHDPIYPKDYNDKEKFRLLFTNHIDFQEDDLITSFSIIDTVDKRDLDRNLLFKPSAGQRNFDLRKILQEADFKETIESPQFKGRTSKRSYYLFFCELIKKLLSNYKERELPENPHISRKLKKK